MLSLNVQAAPTWDNPIDMLYACHGKVKRFCQQLLLLPDYLEQYGLNEANYQAVWQIRQYFSQAAPLHHADEEDNFFPVLLHYVPTAQADVDELARQHHVLHENWDLLHQQLNQLLDKQRIQIDVDVIQQFTQGYAKHVAIEEPLFDLGRQHIPLSEQKKIGKLMAKRRGLVV